MFFRHVVNHWCRLATPSPRRNVASQAVVDPLFKTFSEGRAFLTPEDGMEIPKTPQREATKKEQWPSLLFLLLSLLLFIVIIIIVVIIIMIIIIIITTIIIIIIIIIFIFWVFDADFDAWNGSTGDQPDVQELGSARISLQLVRCSLALGPWKTWHTCSNNRGP